MPALRLPGPLRSARPRRSLRSQCELCRLWSDDALCPDCRALHAPMQPRCEGCGRRLAGAAARCGDCLREPPPFTGCRCAVDYGHPWDRLISDFKYRQRVELAGTLSRQLAACLGDARADLVLAVPLTRERLRERGYNQAWELGRRVARARCVPACADLLQRRFDGMAHQAGLTRADRLRNLRGAFFVTLPARIAGLHVALVDDVMTTGATLAEAARTLLDSGAADVQVWALARTP